MAKAKEEDEWIEVGIVEKVLIYPLKSGKGKEVRDATIMRHGLVADEEMKDRMLMVVDMENDFNMATARGYPRMSLIDTTVEEKTIRFEAPEMPPLEIARPKSMGMLVETRIWGDEVQGLDLGPEVASWMTRYIQGKSGLNMRVLCVSEIDGPFRAHHKKVYNERMNVGDIPIYADGFPFLLTSEESIKELNRFLLKKNEGIQVSETNFRPNIHIKTNEGILPFEEQNWKMIMINDCKFRNVKPCTRCSMTAVDPSTGKRNKNGQPLRVLRTKCRGRGEFAGLPIFGINLAMDHLQDQKKNIIKGDVVYATLISEPYY